MIIDLPNREDPNADILQLLFLWLCDPSHGPWLLILDSADNSNTFFRHGVPSGVESDASQEASEQLARYFPHSSKGSILVTSRNDNAALNLVGSSDGLIEVSYMTNNMALDLLSAKLPEKKMNKPAGIKLVEFLKGIPLAINHAAAYIDRRQEMSIDDYMRLLSRNEKSLSQILGNERGSDLRRDPAAPTSVILTLHTSLDQLGKDSDLAVGFMAVMSVLDRNAIPKALLSVEGEEDTVEEILSILVAYSLVVRTSQHDILHVHWWLSLL